MPGSSISICDFSGMGLIMDLQALQASLADCPCGRPHETGVRVVIHRGLLPGTGSFLRESGFSGRLLAVADENTLAVSAGLRDSLENAGFTVVWQVYPDMRAADMAQVEEITALADGCCGILSVGSGSINDICRLASFRAGVLLAIFATAPSMDGFASNSAPITTNGFKVSHFCKQPELILADTEILAAAPAELKAAGFGDMIAKYAALADWRISHLTTGEYYCERIAALVRQTLAGVTALADRIGNDDPDTAGTVMEGLVLSGIAMQLAGCVRPASGAEHIISHYWEIKKLERGQLSDFHGKKVGVATLIIARLYHRIIDCEAPDIHEDNTDWEAVYRVYGPAFRDNIAEMNTPTVTQETNPALVRDMWHEICRAVREELPDAKALESLMIAAGAPCTLAEIGVSRRLGAEGLRYHAYMRHRMTLTRLLPMLTIDANEEQLLV